MQKNGSVVETFSYDDNGNRLTTNAIQVPAVIDEQDRLISYGNYNYEYDANGSLTKRVDSNIGAETLYEYDIYSNLRKLTTENGDIIEYAVDGLNRRIAKIKNGKRVIGWIYKDQLNPVVEVRFDANEAVSSVTHLFYAETPHSPSYLIRDGVEYKVISDHLGSVRVIVNAQTGQGPYRRHTLHFIPDTWFTLFGVPQESWTVFSGGLIS